MIKGVFYFILPFLLAATGSNTGNDNQEPAAPQATQTALHTDSDIRELCYASRTRAANSASHFNYEFVHLLIEGEKVRGTWRSYPYGTDGMEASLTGVYKAATREIHTQANMLGEGQLMQQARSLKLLEDAVQLDYKDAQQRPATLPQVSCERFDELLDEFHTGILRNVVNTTDRSRLLQFDGLADMGFTQKELREVKFMEREVDLDRNYQTREYLLYVMDPMVCGSGGCNLFVIDDKGKTLSSISVVKLPVYTTSTTMEDGKNNKGVWKELYVHSQGLRRLTPNNRGKYPDNASVQPPVVEEQITLHPERYTLMLDYLDGK